MFFGREEILEQLDAQLASPIASLVTCRGRRRIGKSTLIEEFARRSKVRFIKLEGLSPREADSNQKQLTAFARQLSEQTGVPLRPLAFAGPLTPEMVELALKAAPRVVIKERSVEILQEYGCTEFVGTKYSAVRFGIRKRQ